jgi:hypothetical protein
MATTRQMISRDRAINRTRARDQKYYGESEVPVQHRTKEFNKLFEQNLIPLVRRIDKQWCPKSRIMDITYSVEKNDYFTTVSSHFFEMFENGGGDGFSRLHFHLFDGDESEEDFTTSIEKNNYMLMLNVWFVVYDTVPPTGWKTLTRLNTPSSKVLISFEELKRLIEATN